MSERRVSFDGLPALRQVEWHERFPTLVQGITLRSPDFDFPLADGRAPAPSGEARTRKPQNGWAHLLSAAAIPCAARCRQVHGAEVRVCEEPPAPGVALLGEGDALITERRGVLLAVTVADCVPVFLVDEETPLIALAHAGWRGTAAGVVESTVRALVRRGATVESLRVHLGAAICGRCYEVGPEVLSALGLGAGHGGEGGGRVDLRDLLGQRCAALGIEPRRVTRSAGCTRCDGLQFYSYRRGDSDRRMCAFIGWSAR